MWNVAFGKSKPNIFCHLQIVTLLLLGVSCRFKVKWKRTQWSWIITRVWLLVEGMLHCFMHIWNNILSSVTKSSRFSHVSIHEIFLVWKQEITFGKCLQNGISQHFPSRKMCFPPSSFYAILQIGLFLFSPFQLYGIKIRKQPIWWIIVQVHMNTYRSVWACMYLLSFLPFQIYKNVL